MFLLVMLRVANAATTGKISGRVLDADTGEPLFGANVIIDGTNLGASTDDEGDYYILRVPPGTYMVRASMIGYEIMAQTNVRVQADRTVRLNYNLSTSILEGEVVVVEAMREVIKMDISGSETRVSGEDILSVSTVSTVEDFLDLTAGVQGLSIRGGGAAQTGFLLDGMDMVDNRSNTPVITVNLSSVEEVSVIKGGFSAEYGNVRSGLISVVTKEGSTQEYHGSVDLRLSPAHQKHEGPALTGHDNWWTRPYLDPDVDFAGTSRGNWDNETKAQNQVFVGWDKISQTLLSDDDPNNDKTPEECRDMFLWEHALEGSGALGQEEAKYAHKPDWEGELSFSGPVPIIGRMLGDMSFFASTRKEYSLFASPVLVRDQDGNPWDAFESLNSQIKFTSHISNSMKLNIDLMFNDIRTLMEHEGIEEPTDDDYLRSGERFNGHVEGWGGTPFEVKRRMQGFTFDHVLSPRSYYSVKFSRLNVENLATHLLRDERDLTTLRFFGNDSVDGRPWGIHIDAPGNLLALGDGYMYSTVGYGNEDSSSVTTYNAKIDYTSQLNKYHQIKTGAMLNIDHLKTVMRSNFGAQQQGLAGNHRRSDHSPIRIGAYITNRLEFEGMIANLGLRLDYNDPNTDWYDLETYDDWFKAENRDNFLEDAPTTSADKGHWRLSPRFGMSHPISATSKIYFNYGHFYSMPVSSAMYRIGTFEAAHGITYLANPYIEPPRTVQYELGYETTLYDMFLLSVVGYYRDVSKQSGEVAYTGFNSRVDYTTTNNNHYADTRGVEFTLEKRFGRWINAWFNYNYMVETDGMIGFSHYYQDPKQQAQLVEPYGERPIAQPFARGNIEFMSPIDFGPELGGIKPLADWSMSFLVTWAAGDYTTWNPEDVFGLELNVQTADYWDVDMRIGRTLDIGNTTMTIFADVINPFGIKRLNLDSFSGQSDYEKYMKSLNLKMYQDRDRYPESSYGPDAEEFNFSKDDYDKPGDHDKEYIDMPDIDSFWFMNPTHVWMGLQFEF